MISELKEEFRPYMGFYYFWAAVSFAALIFGIVCGKMGI